MQDFSALKDSTMALWALYTTRKNKNRQIEEKRKKKIVAV